MRLNMKKIVLGEAWLSHHQGVLCVRLDDGTYRTYFAVSAFDGTNVEASARKFDLQARSEVLDEKAKNG